jgi:hypothetical protein
MPTSRPVQTQSKLGEILEYYSDIEDLGNEMEEWRDNMPDSLQSLGKYQQVEEAADALASAASELEEACTGIKEILKKTPTILNVNIKYTYHKMYKGYQMPRWVRLANLCAALEAAMQFLEGPFGIKPRDVSEEDFSALKSYMEQVDTALSDLQGVDFPTMFG